MISNPSVRILHPLWLLLTPCLLMVGCGSSEKEKAAPPDEAIVVKAARFEKHLFAGPAGDSGMIHALRKEYGSFFELFSWQLTNAGSKDSARFEANLRTYSTDTGYQALRAAIEKRFPDFSPYEISLTEAFRKYHSFLPDRTVPELLTTISDFSYPVICDSHHLALSLEMYLDPGCIFYDNFQPPLPNYLRRRMQPEFLVADAMKGWLQSDFAVDESESDLLERMISSGRIWYAMKKIVPDAHDTLVSGYSARQLDWCIGNESRIWSFLVDNKLLYATDPNVLIKYVGEGPTTNGFPKESPGNIGQFIGYRIVSAYMASHKQVTLASLLEDKDLAKLFRESKYKPKR